MSKKILGVLGGMGPAASARFYTMLTEFTKAERDGDHMEILLHSLPAIPDRTDFILGKSEASPLPFIRKAILKLGSCGAEIIAIPCNTAEFFYEELAKSCPLPILRTAYTACRFAHTKGVKKLGILATEGSVHAKIYEKHLLSFGISFSLPSEKTQKAINTLIYSRIKKAIPSESDILDFAACELCKNGCDAAVLGCTELSLAPHNIQDFYIDSLSVLAAESVKACGYELSEKGKNTL